MNIYSITWGGNQGLPDESKKEVKEWKKGDKRIANLVLTLWHYLPLIFMISERKKYTEDQFASNFCSLFKDPSDGDQKPSEKREFTRNVAKIAMHV
jgi:hypothetical protein